MENGLVSIITPCYNTSKYISRLLDSVLSQDYPCISMLVVDDGSTDDSREVIESYISRFVQKGYNLEYKYQENSGQSVAINNALKWVDGEYMVWPDSDDWFTSEQAISKMVFVCAKFPNIGMVRCLYKHVNEKMECIGQMRVSSRLLEKDQFENCIFHYGGNFAAGACMVRMDVFDECIPGREIYTEKKAGQNGQLMLPVLYNHDCITIPEYLFSVLSRKNSHSQGVKSFEQSSGVIYGYIHQVHSTLEMIKDIPERKLNDYKDRVLKLYLPDIFVIAVLHGRKDVAKELKKQLQALGGFNINLAWRFRYHFCQYGWFRNFVSHCGSLIR